MTGDSLAALPLIQPLSLLADQGMVCTDDYCFIPGAVSAEDAVVVPVLPIDQAGVPLSR